MKTIAKRPLIGLAIASVLLAFGVAASGEAADALLRRYPYDPACPWGRIGNGKGIIVRCLSESEAQTLRAGSLPTGPTGSATPALSADVPAPGASAPPDTSDADASASQNPIAEKLDVAVGPVTADSGELGVGKLRQPKEKYVKCVNDNGGLKDSSGQVEVRFLVRARGRAEGVSVAKRTNLTQEAARCISEVVDRRYVGIPADPIVGATVVIKFTKASK